MKNGDSAVSHCHPPELRDVERVVGDVLAGVRVLGALYDDASLEELGDVDGHREDDDGDGVGGHTLRHAELFVEKARLGPQMELISGLVKSLFMN